MKWLFLEPADVLTFRDGRPYDAGEGHRPGNLFPPAPFTIQGAIRSTILGSSKVSWADYGALATPAAKELAGEIGHNELTSGFFGLGQLALRGPFQARINSGKLAVYFPLPLDIYPTTENERVRWRTLQPSRQRLVANWSLQPLRPRADQPVADEDQVHHLLDLAALNVYLNGESFSPEESTPFMVEPRLGIAIDYGPRRVREGMLYQQDFMRPAFESHGQAGLAVQIADPAILPAQRGELALGGEQRAARYEIMPESAASNWPISKSALRMKIVLLTPAWFSDGWQPKDGDWSILLGQPGICLVAAALGRTQFLGGWQLANGRQKVLRGFVPAGSVFYFEADEPIQPPQTFTETPENNLNFSAQGFGACVSTSWEWLND